MGDNVMGSFRTNRPPRGRRLGRGRGFRTFRLVRRWFRHESGGIDTNRMAVDRLSMQFYSSLHPRGPHVQGIQFYLGNPGLEESFREEGAPPHATPADDPKLSIEGTNDDTQPSGEDTDDSPQTEYIRVHREVYRDLIGQLGTKDKQIARKDT